MGIPACVHSKGNGVNLAAGRAHANHHRWLLVTIIACTSVLPATFLWAPALSMELADKLGLTPTRIGMVFSIELIFSCLATLPAFFWLKSRHLHYWGFVFISTLAVLNLISAWLLEPYFNLFLVSRGVAALANGSLMILCTHSVGRLPDRGRGFGALLFGQLILGTAGIAVLPLAFRHFGPGVCFTLQALLLFLCVPLYRNFAHHNDEKIGDEKADATGPEQPDFPRHGLLGVAAVFLQYICLGGTWTFIGAVQEPVGMSRALMEQLLVVASAVGMLGAGAAIVLGHARYRRRCLLAGFMAQSLALFSITALPLAGAVYASALMLQFTWTLLMPFMFTVVSLHDNRRGRLINLTNMVLGLGLGVGPAICGWLLETFQYQVMFSFGLAVTILAALAIYRSDSSLKKHAPDTRADWREK